MSRDAVRASDLWFYRLPEEMPPWKRWAWRIFGVKRVGIDNGYRVTVYYFRGINLIWEFKHEAN